MRFKWCLKCSSFKIVQSILNKIKMIWQATVCISKCVYSRGITDLMRILCVIHYTKDINRIAHKKRSKYFELLIEISYCETTTIHSNFAPFEYAYTSLIQIAQRIMNIPYVVKTNKCKRVKEKKIFDDFVVLLYSVFLRKKIIQIQNVSNFSWYSSLLKKFSDSFQ